jgi:hypothetical protein
VGKKVAALLCSIMYLRLHFANGCPNAKRRWVSFFFFFVCV